MYQANDNEFDMKKKLFWMMGIILTVLIVSIVIGISYTGNNASQFKGPVLTGESLPDAMIANLEKYVARVMRQNDVPGVAMVLAQGDQIIYARGMGVRDLETKEPMNTNTLLGIGSTTKSMTAIMIASLVDEGVISWDTPVTDILPTFALSKPEITNAITFEHTLCMCTGVPARIEDISVQYSELTAEDMIESLATIPLVGAFERHFGYSERMLSAGGYIAAMAVGGEYSDLARAYARVMQEQVFNPLGMTSSTFSIDEALASGNYATPHYSSPLLGSDVIAPEIEGIFTPIAPTGALWSTADDLGKYLIMLLNDGVAADGRRVVSAENLAFLWEPRVAIDAQTSYGLGWYVEDYHGLTVIHHCGGTVGFASELVVIPEYDIGFALLTNQMDQIVPIGRMATYRLLEMLTGSEQVYDQEIRRTARDIGWQTFTLSLITRKTVDPDKIAPFLGTYHNDLLGNVSLVLHDDHTLWVDFGEYEAAIRPLVLEENQYIFYESTFVGKTIRLNMNPDGMPTMRWPGNEGTYNLVSEMSTQE